MLINHCVLDWKELHYPIAWSIKRSIFEVSFFQTLSTLSTLFSLMIADTYMFFSSVPKRKLKSNNRIKRFVYHVPYIAQCLKWYNYQKTNILARKFKNYILILYLFSNWFRRNFAVRIFFIAWKIRYVFFYHFKIQSTKLHEKYSLIIWNVAICCSRKE